MAPPSALLRAVRENHDTGYRGGMSALAAVLLALAMQNAPAPAPAAPPAQRPKLLERPTIRPSRAGGARQNYAQEVDPAPTEPAPIDQSGATAAAVDAPIDSATGTGAPPEAPAADAAPGTAGPIRMAPSAVAPVAPQGGMQATAPPAAGRKPLPIEKLVPVAALAMLIGPAIGAIWFLGRTGGQPGE